MHSEKQKNSPYRSLLFSLTLILILLLSSLTAYGSSTKTDIPVRIGVLAKRGADFCRNKWTPTIDYLSEHIEGYSFSLLPLTFKQIEPAVEKQEVDFLFANPSYYVVMEVREHVERIATLINKDSDDRPVLEFGGVVVSLTERNDINKFKDLVGKRFVSVDPKAFAAWQSVKLEFLRKGVRPGKDFSELTFTDTEDQVIYDIRDGKADAGSVRTNILERMAKEGKINLADFKVIAHQNYKHKITHLHSTDYYPEWPLAKLSHTDNRLAELVATNLINMLPTNQAARQGSYYGWTIPLNYQPVHECLKRLKEPPYENYGKLSLLKTFHQHKLTVYVFAVFFLLLLLQSLKLKSGNLRLKKSIIDRENEQAKRQKIEGLLQKRQEELASIYQASPTGMGVVVDRVFQDVNPCFCEMVGYSEQELLGKSSAMVYPSAKEHQRIGREHQRLVAEHRVSIIESAMQHKNGNIINILISWIPLDQGDLSAGIVFNILDITEQRKISKNLLATEKKYREMMESMSDPVYICSQDYRVEYMNPAMIERNGQDARGEFCYQAIHGFTQPCPWCKDKDKSQGMYFEADITSPKDKHAYHISISPITNEDGSISSMIVFRDTTEMKKLEQQLRQSHKMEAVGTLAGGIAHDFNNILTSVLCFAETAQDSISVDCQAYDDISEVIKGGNRAAKLVKQILALSRKGTEKLEPLKPHLVIKEAIKLLRASLPATVSIEEEIDPEAGEVLADQTQIHQIIMNLCTNAFHALENEKGVLRIKLRRVELGATELAEETEVSPGPFIALSVSDTGCGMDRAIIERIFEPYFTTKDVNQGSGLGLAVIHGIVKKYKGFIGVESELGQGTSFHIYIPALEKEAETQGKAVKQATLAGGTERVLVVDDEEAIARINKTILERLGYKVTAITDSRKALKLFRNQPDQFDLIVTDQSMPDLTGFELAQEVLKIKSAIPIILCTGYSAVISEEEARAIGIRRYLFKPISRTTLVQIVRQVLDES